MSTVLNALNLSLHQALADDERVVLLGEDILDPYGGAFKVTRGLSTAFPDRVLTTPISEAGMVGIAAGMALRGLKPVVEIMFGDFLTLAADQLINHAAKFRSMYNEQVRVPLVVRTPMGGRRGYGPTHSQTLEKLFLGVPGLHVLAPAALKADDGPGPGELLYNAILHTEDPVLFIENKLLYLQTVQGPGSLAELELEQMPGSGSQTGCPAFRLSLKGAPAPQITLAAYGYMAQLAQQTIIDLAYRREIFADLVVLTQLSPFDLEPVLACAARSGRLLAVEEGSLSLGWGAEVVAQASETLGPRLKAAGRCAARDAVIPASAPLEAAVLPGAADIFTAALRLVSPR
jgi:pyruvate/2-oxoglutarate/acetoin dehydrogenase E1 component